MGTTTETTAPAERAKQVRERLNELAPYPATDEATTARSLARWLAMRSAVINHQQLSPDVPMSRSRIDLLTILFAAAHALYALDEIDSDTGAVVAKEIRDAWDDGGGVGEWLWEHLGGTACAEIGPLADELGAMQRPADGLLAHADAIRDALNHSAMNARSAEYRERFVKALSALDNELEQKRETTP